MLTVTSLPLLHLLLLIMSLLLSLLHPAAWQGAFNHSWFKHTEFRWQAMLYCSISRCERATQNTSCALCYCGIRFPNPTEHGPKGIINKCNVPELVASPSGTVGLAFISRQPTDGRSPEPSSITAG